MERRGVERRHGGLQQGPVTTCAHEATDDHGVGIRRYPKQRVSVHVTVKGLGRARPTEQIGTCPVRREGNTFFFAIAEQVIIVSR